VALGCEAFAACVQSIKQLMSLVTRQSACRKQEAVKSFGMFCLRMAMNHIGQDVKLKLCAVLCVSAATDRSAHVLTACAHLGTNCRISTPIKAAKGKSPASPNSC